MTYNVLMGALNPTHSLTHSLTHLTVSGWAKMSVELMRRLTRAAWKYVYYCRQEDYVIIGVCFLAGRILQQHSTDFHIFRWKSGTSATEETVRFWW